VSSSDSGAVCDDIKGGGFANEGERDTEKRTRWRRVMATGTEAGVTRKRVTNLQRGRMGTGGGRPGRAEEGGGRIGGWRTPEFRERAAYILKQPPGASRSFDI
jgi:hypothetical protein